MAFTIRGLTVLGPVGVFRRSAEWLRLEQFSGQFDLAKSHNPRSNRSRPNEGHGTRDANPYGARHHSTRHHSACDPGGSGISLRSGSTRGLEREPGIRHQQRRRVPAHYNAVGGYAV